jgi:hypothetical protein
MKNGKLRFYDNQGKVAANLPYQLLHDGLVEMYLSDEEGYSQHSIWNEFEAHHVGVFTPSGDFKHVFSYPEKSYLSYTPKISLLSRSYSGNFQSIILDNSLDELEADLEIRITDINGLPIPEMEYTINYKGKTRKHKTNADGIGSHSANVGHGLIVRIKRQDDRLITYPVRYLMQKENIWHYTVSSVSLEVQSTQPDNPSVDVTANLPYMKAVEPTTITSQFALDQIFLWIDEISEVTFISMMVPMFGTDIPKEAYQTLYDNCKNKSLLAPEYVISDEGLDNHWAGFNKITKTITFSPTFIDKIVKAKVNNSQAAIAILFTILLEEFGHYLDDLLRNVYSTTGGDALYDEGAIFAYSLVHFDLANQTTLTLAELEHPGYKGPIQINWQEAIGSVEEYASVEDQINDSKTNYFEFFGAGMGNINDAHSHGHQSIELILSEVGFDRNTELPYVYLGNWLRDFSQIIDPAIVSLPAGASREAIKSKEALTPDFFAHFSNGYSRDFLTRLIGYLAIKSFMEDILDKHSIKPEDLNQTTLQDINATEAQKELIDHIETLIVKSDINKAKEVVGGYRWQEHMDNPTSPAGLDASVDASLINPVFNPQASSKDLSVNPNTGMRYHIESSIEYLEERFKMAMDAGPTKEGLRYFGEGLHLLEDYYAHSNFIEVGLIQMGHKKVIPWVTLTPAMKAGQELIPITTGLFGSTDVLGSLLPKVAAMIPHEVPPYKGAKRGVRTPTDQILLLAFEEKSKQQALSNSDIPSNKQGKDNSPILENEYQEYLELRDKWADKKEDNPKLEAALEAKHNGLNTGLVIINMPLSIGANLVGENVGSAQTLSQEITGEKLGTNPSHSQLAKDHDHHHLHDLAAQLAMIAVRDTGEAMKAYWNGNKTSDPVSVARKYIVHPENMPINIEEYIKKWSKNNLARIVRSESKTDAGHYYDQTKEDLKLLKESIKESHKQIEVLFNRFF